ncbi:unnamed protein product, partial [marine sediment metagenome]
MIILIILVGRYLLSLIVENLNISCASPVLPREFEGYYDTDTYKRSQNYLKEKTRFALIKDTIFTSVILAFMLVGGFNFVDNFARSFNLGPILIGLIFIGALILAIQLLNIPFSVYHTFVIEERYGFNRTDAKTFVLDILKRWLLGVVIGGIVFSVILWLFGKMGSSAWIYCWIAAAFFQLFLVFIEPIVILPLFNKFLPLEDGKLKDTIDEYTASENFKVKGVFKMDASRRSAESNAFFTGFGRFRRIVLFDTIIEGRIQA